MKATGVKIEEVAPGSIAEQLGINKGDKLLSINGVQIRDIIEYKYITTDEFLEIEVEKPDGEQWILEVEKEYDDDIGLVFDGIIDSPKSCHNKCIFCFIDQLPKGMRETMYFKDDDTRLSFLQGNFVTLTNLGERDINRIIRYRISPINVSVHTTDPELRVRMLNNKNAGRLMAYLRRLKENGIEIKAQIVLCPGVNDGAQLERTIGDLKELYPELNCTAVVPVGLTKYREGLYALKGFDREQAGSVIDQVEAMQAELLKVLGSRFVFLSDEFYILAGRELPGYDTYEGFPQLENGVGLITLLREEVDSSLEDIRVADERPRRMTIATGEYAAPYLREETAKIMKAVKNLDIEVTAIKNDFFGHDVKVSGLVTGGDIIKQLSRKGCNDILLIPDNMLKKGEAIFLDDVTLEELEAALKVRIRVCREDGSDLVEKIMAI